jgi:hypothetical protein
MTMWITASPVGARDRAHALGTNPAPPSAQRRQSVYALLHGPSAEAAMASAYTGILCHHFPLPYSLSRLLFSLYLNLSSEGVPLRYPVMRVAAVIPQLDMGAETLPTQNALERQRYGT